MSYCVSIASHETKLFFPDVLTSPFDYQLHYLNTAIDEMQTVTRRLIWVNTVCAGLSIQILRIKYKTGYELRHKKMCLSSTDGQLSSRSAMKPHNLITVYVIQYIRMYDPYPVVSKIL